MSLCAFILIFISIFMHVGWNVLSKANRPSAAFYFLLNLVSAVFLMLFLPFYGVDWRLPDTSFWLAVLASVGFETLYSIGLFMAYRKADVSVAYPLMRSIPVLLTPIVTIAFRMGKVPGALALVGMAIVAAGCLILQYNPADKKGGLLSWSVILPVLLAASGTTGYTVIDNLATDKLAALECCSSPLLYGGWYFMLVEIGLTIVLASYVMTNRTEREEFFKVCIRMPYPYYCGLLNCGAYTLVIIAMKFVTNVSYVQAFRQMGLPLCVIIGWLMLHEKLTRNKIAGVLAIFLGLLLTII